MMMINRSVKICTYTSNSSSSRLYKNIYNIKNYCSSTNTNTQQTNLNTPASSNSLNELSSNPNEKKNLDSIFTRLFGKTNEDKKINPTVDPKSIDKEELQIKKQQNPQRKPVDSMQFYSSLDNDNSSNNNTTKNIKDIQPKKSKSLFGIDVENGIDEEFINNLKESHPTPFEIKEPVESSKSNTFNKKVSFYDEITEEDTELKEQLDIFEKENPTLQSSSSSSSRNRNRIQLQKNEEEQQLDNNKLQQFRQYTEEKSSKIDDDIPMSEYTKLVTEYHDMLETCKDNGDAPQFKQLNFMIENVPLDMENVDMHELLQKNFDYPIDDLYCEFIHDHSLKGKLLSMLVVLRYHTNQVAKDLDEVLEKINESSDQPSTSEVIDEKQQLINSDSSPDTLYDKFKLYGIIFKGVRYNIISPKSMMTLKVQRIPEAINETLLRQHLDERVELSDYQYKVHFPETHKNAHIEASNLPPHPGFCYISFGTHVDALKSFAALYSISYDRKKLNVNWSRKIFSDESDAASLYTKLASRKVKSFKELAMMRTIMDLSSEVEHLRDQLHEKSGKSSSSTKKERKPRTKKVNKADA